MGPVQTILLYLKTWGIIKAIKVEVTRPVTDNEMDLLRTVTGAQVTHDDGTLTIVFTDEAVDV